MGFLEDLKNGDIKSIILVILVILIFHLYWCKSSVQFAKSTKQSRCNEPMTNVSNDIKEAVKQVYLADVEAIRNLSEVATKINAGTFVFPGNLTVTGTIKSNGEISNNSFSLSGLNNSINSINSSLSGSISNSINNVNSNLNNQVNSINSQLSNKINKNSTISLEDISNPGFKLGTSNWERSKVVTANIDRLAAHIPLIFYRQWKISDA
jgi:hypothetical protein